MNVISTVTGTLTLSDFSELQTDRFGLSGATAKWTFNATGSMTTQWSSLQGQLPSLYSAHPVFDFLEMESRRVTWNGVNWEVIGQFFGIDGDSTDPIFELQADGNVEPIETHPDFADFGTAANGAKFDSDGLFLGFGDKTKPDWYGVTSYIRPGAVWIETYYSRFLPTDLNNIGKIDEPDGYEPNVAQSRDWLLLDINFQQRGAAYQIRKSWKASGPNGWNTTIYS